MKMHKNLANIKTAWIKLPNRHKAPTGYYNIQVSFASRANTGLHIKKQSQIHDKYSCHSWFSTRSWEQHCMTARYLMYNNSQYMYYGTTERSNTHQKTGIHEITCLPFIRTLWPTWKTDKISQGNHIISFWSTNLHKNIVRNIPNAPTPLTYKRNTSHWSCYHTNYTWYTIDTCIVPLVVRNISYKWKVCAHILTTWGPTCIHKSYICNMYVFILFSFKTVECVLFLLLFSLSLLLFAA